MPNNIGVSPAVRPWHVSQLCARPPRVWGRARSNAHSSAALCGQTHSLPSRPRAPICERTSNRRESIRMKTTFDHSVSEVSVSTNRICRRSGFSRRSKLASLALPFLAAAIFAVLLRQTVLAAPTPGTLVIWGDQTLSYVEPGTRFTKLAAGGLHSLALKQDGTVVACGWNYAGQAIVPGDLTNVMAVAAGYQHSLALKSDGTVVGWGRSDYDRLNIPVGLSNVVAVAAGGSHNLALKPEGTLVAWGNSYYDQLNFPAGLSNVTAIAAGAFHGLALKQDGNVVAWGANDYAMATVPDGLSDVAAIAAGDYFNLAWNATELSWRGDTTTMAKPRFPSA